MRALVAVSAVGHRALRACWGTYLVQLLSPEVQRRQPAAASAKVAGAAAATARQGPGSGGRPPRAASVRALDQPARLLPAAPHLGL